MRIVIFEDERDNAERLIRLLQQCNPEITVPQVIGSVSEGTAWFRRNGDEGADLVFMDIQLSDGNCFEIFETTNSRIPLIFTTAYDKYALQAFKLYSLDYLLKPVDIRDLQRALDKFSRFRPEPQEQLSRIAEALLRRDETRFTGKMNNQLVYVKARNIAYLDIEDGIVWAITHSGQRTPLDYSLEQVEKMLDRVLFFRINRRVIVHIDAIRKITTYYNNRLILQLAPAGASGNGHIVSRERVNNFKNWLQGRISGE